MNRIEEKYTCRGTPSVRRFLHAHPQLIDVLLDAHTLIENCFGIGSRVVLEIVQDPEAEGAAEELFALIQTNVSVHAAMERLGKLDDWYLDQSGEIIGLFCIDVEFC